MNLLFGFLSIILGLAIIENPVFYLDKYRHTVDLTGHNIFVGGLLIIFGAYEIWLELKKYPN